MWCLSGTFYWYFWSLLDVLIENCFCKKLQIACKFETTWESLNFHSLDELFQAMRSVWARFLFEKMWTALRDAVLFQMGAVTGWNAGVLLMYAYDMPPHSLEICSDCWVVFYFVWQGIFLQKSIDPFQKLSAFSSTKAILKLFSNFSVLLLGACVCEVKSY